MLATETDKYLYALLDGAGVATVTPGYLQVQKDNTIEIPHIIYRRSGREDTFFTDNTGVPRTLQYSITLVAEDFDKLGALENAVMPKLIDDKNVFNITGGFDVGDPISQ